MSTRVRRWGSRYIVEIWTEDVLVEEVVVDTVEEAEELSGTVIVAE